jgi:hypothetical protein
MHTVSHHVLILKVVNMGYNMENVMFIKYISAV